MTLGILVILNLLSQEMVFPKSLSGIVVSACSDAACFRLYLYGAISKINKLAGEGVFKLYRIFIAIDGAMILLSFSAKCAPVSTRKVLFFVICDTAMLAFLLWIKIKTRRQAKRPIFRL